MKNYLIASESSGAWMYGHAEEWRPAWSRLVQWVKRGWAGAPAVPIATRDVSARIGGIVRQVLVHREQLVAEGDLLLELDSRLLSLRVDQAIVMLQSARAIVAAAAASVSRKSGEPPPALGPFDLAGAHAFHEELAASEAHSLSAARARLSRARRMLQEAEMELSSARLERRYAEVRAPIAATVLSCNVSTGQFVHPDEPLLLLKAS
ncbi:MAG TPA: biotin/lipoyl-binding protein [Myxococcales bacterium]|jgi:multidrug efflux pump subunit AcrA (membrane-fusion protein)|nr:biotin/lipoyl-binding protein [Myxococcales bacterium]